MLSYKRHCKKWSISELLSLEKELDRNMSIAEIASSHQRTKRAILFKIHQQQQQTDISPSKNEPEISNMFHMNVLMY